MLRNLVGIVTGGASGLGKAAATALVEGGCRITICDLPQSPGREVTEELSKINPETIFSPVDVCSTADVSKMLSSVKQQYGRLDFVVNCAGISSSHKIYNFFSKKTYDITKMKRVIETNVIGTLNVIRLAAPYIGENTPDEDGLCGTIINTAGIEGCNGQMGQTITAASSGAIAAMTTPLSRDLSERGIRVMCICVGLFNTPLLQGIPDKVKFHMAQSCAAPKRFGKEEEFGHAVKFLLENRYMNGEMLKINGALNLCLD